MLTNYGRSHRHSFFSTTENNYVGFYNSFIHLFIHSSLFAQKYNITQGKTIRTELYTKRSFNIDILARCTPAT